MDTVFAATAAGTLVAPPAGEGAIEVIDVIGATVVDGAAVAGAVVAGAAVADAAGLVAGALVPEDVASLPQAAIERAAAMPRPAIEIRRTFTVMVRCRPSCG